MIAETALPPKADSPSADPLKILKGRDILCFSHDWSGDPLSKTHLMRLLSKHNRILWVNSIGYRAPTASKADLKRAFRKISAAASPIREPEKNIFVLNPLAIPAYGNPALRELNRRLLRFQVRRAMKRLGFDRAINWVFNPAAGLIAGGLGEESLIYHCVDEYTAFTGVSSRSLAEIEESLLRRADAVFVSASRLLHSKGAVNPRTFLVRHGVDHDHFRRALDSETPIPEDLAKLHGPIIGYFGLIAEDWVDIDLLVHVARSFPEASLVLLGKVTMDVSRLEALPNVHFLGRKPYESLPSYSKGFDVALIPFPVTEVTLNANPLKAREYLASGLPVVSTAIPEVEVLGLCRIGRDHDGFVKEVANALREPGPSVVRSEAVRGQSWAGRLEEIRFHLTTLEKFRSGSVEPIRP
jgi:glycosyltransferase involved in cell wall biosynthesis